MKKTSTQYRLEALARAKAVSDKTTRKKKKKSKLSIFRKITNGGYLVRMIKQERV